MCFHALNTKIIDELFNTFVLHVFLIHFFGYVVNDGLKQMSVLSMGKRIRADHLYQAVDFAHTYPFRIRDILNLK
jgi:hypothetical protein